MLEADLGDQQTLWLHDTGQKSGGLGSHLRFSGGLGEVLSRSRVLI